MKAPLARYSRSTIKDLSTGLTENLSLRFDHACRAERVLYGLRRLVTSIAGGNGGYSRAKGSFISPGRAGLKISRAGAPGPSIHPTMGCRLTLSPVSLRTLAATSGLELDLGSRAIWPDWNARPENSAPTRRPTGCQIRVRYPLSRRIVPANSGSVSTKAVWLATLQAALRSSPPRTGCRRAVSFHYILIKTDVFGWLP